MKKITIFIFAAIISLSLSSCKKEYTSEFSFWNNKATSEKLVADGVTQLSFYLGNNLEGTRNVNEFFEGEPSCKSSETFKIFVVSEETKTYDFTVEDQDGYLVWKGTLSNGTGGCLITEITY